MDTKEFELPKVMEKLCEEMCANYCKYPADYTDETLDKLYEDHCDNCTLMRLI